MKIEAAETKGLERKAAKVRGMAHWILRLR